jgi:hypothetical protein
LGLLNQKNIIIQETANLLYQNNLFVIHSKSPTWDVSTAIEIFTEKTYSRLPDFLNVNNLYKKKKE